MTIVFRYREEASEITGNILRPVASLEFKSLDGEWIEIRMNELEFSICVAWALEEDGDFNKAKEVERIGLDEV